MTRTATAIARAYLPRFCSSFEQRMHAEYGDAGGILAGPVHGAHVDAGQRFDLVHIPADSLDVADGLYRAMLWFNAAESFVDGSAGVPYHQAEAALDVVLGAYLTKAQLRELVDLCHQWSEAPSVALAALRDEDRADVVRALEAAPPACAEVTWNAETGRATATYNDGAEIVVRFGWVDASGHNFRSSYCEPNRTYKTAKGAARAADLWVNA